VSTSPSMSWRSFVLHVVAGYFAIGILGAAVVAIATRKSGEPFPVSPKGEEDDAPRSETP
jgi:hypothetical protein